MEFIINNWYLIIAFLCVVCGLGYMVYHFFKLPTSKQIDNLKEWLKYAVVEAERVLGSGTGKLKLRMVYDMAIQKFPWLAEFIEFEKFSVWVDDALVWMRDVLSSNDAINYIVTGDEDLTSVSINETDDCK